MRRVVQNSDRLALPLLSAWQLSVLLSSVLTLGVANLYAQCPNTGETKVIKPAQGTGYRCYKFIGDSSFVYFLDGKKFSFNDKDDPGKTFISIDDFVYEPLVVEGTEIAKYAKSSETVDILRAQAKHQQDHFKTIVPSMVITDYGSSARKNTDGSDGRIFYLWKKDNPPGSEAAPQYLVSTLINAEVVVMSIIPTKASLSESDAFVQIDKYVSHFDLLSSDRCAKVLAMPIVPQPSK